MVSKTGEAMSSGHEQRDGLQKCSQKVYHCLNGLKGWRKVGMVGMSRKELVEKGSNTWMHRRWDLSLYLVRLLEAVKAARG